MKRKNHRHEKKKKRNGNRNGRGERTFRGIVVEFSEAVKQEALRLANGRCCFCDEIIEECDIEFHHKVPIWYVSRLRSQITAMVLSSVDNCGVTHGKCHKEHHKHNPLRLYAVLIIELLFFLD
jgi:hypothetical protein